MKKLLIIIGLVVNLSVLGQGTRLQPGFTPTPSPVFDFNTISNLTYLIAQQVASNYISTNIVYVSNAFFIITSNFNYISNTFNTNISNIVVQGSALADGFTMQPAYTFVASNGYWLDWGKTNATGQHLIYATLLATNNSVFIGVTNMIPWRPLSFDVIASGANRLLSFPDSFVYFNTNGMTHTAPYYNLTLTNGNMMRVTLQTNLALEIIWVTHGQ